MKMSPSEEVNSEEKWQIKILEEYTTNHSCQKAA